MFLEGPRDRLLSEGLGEPPRAGLGGGTGGMPRRCHVEWRWGAGLREGLSLFSKCLMGHSDNRRTLVRSRQGAGRTSRQDSSQRQAGPRRISGQCGLGSL